MLSSCDSVETTLTNSVNWILRQIRTDEVNERYVVLPQNGNHRNSGAGSCKSLWRCDTGYLDTLSSDSILHAIYPHLLVEQKVTASCAAESPGMPSGYSCRRSLCNISKIRGQN